MADEAAPVERLVTPSLANLGPERLAAVVRGYRADLVELAIQAHHCCAWALEAIDTLVDENRRLRTAVNLATMEIPAPAIAIVDESALHPTAVGVTLPCDRSRRPQVPLHKEARKRGH